MRLKIIVNTTSRWPKFLPMLWCTATDHLCYLTGQSIQMPSSRLVRESSFHNMLYLLLSPLLTIHRQHPTSSLTSNNQIMMQWSTPTILAILSVAEESKNNHFSRDILLFYNFKNYKNKCFVPYMNTNLSEHYYALYMDCFVTLKTTKRIWTLCFIKR